jgi:NitT/TauT family transport system substrate-binding protein
LLALVGTALLQGNLGFAAEKRVIRVGHFPNLTHAQGVIAHGMSRVGKGWFEQRLGPDVEIQWFVYNAGPSAMEAILTGSLDLAYVGPNPAINAFQRSEGNDIRIVAGACSGGAALVVQPDGRIKSDADFRGRRIATPQLGNTQDVAARAWLSQHGFRVTVTGGDVHVIPTSNPDQIILFQRGDVDAVWTVEPWVTRLIREAGGKIYLEESSLWTETGGRYVTTHLVSSARFTQDQSELLARFVAAHVELTGWIQTHPEEARRILRDELKAEMGRALSDETLAQAWKRLEFTWDPVRESLFRSAEEAKRIGLLRGKSDLNRIYHLAPLNKALADAQLPIVK